ncbi:MAG: helix-turn-helix transcriptional regulator [Clostridia bacterium]|nr:helix-turn-helix transcriptional regulator [Clostridia bacterium]
MEFNEKLQKLRTNKGLTQEELSKKLFVSRTAVSKWESGRGYPGIDSLKAIAKFFDVTLDELIGSEELVFAAEQDVKRSDRTLRALVCGALDALAALLFFLPVFADGDALSVFLTGLSYVSGWLKAVFIVTVVLTFFNGLCGAIVSRFDRPVWTKHRIVAGMLLSAAGTAVFMLSRQPYAGFFFLSLLVIKGFLLLNRK